jgi:hypothetical protein
LPTLVDAAGEGRWAAARSVGRMSIKLASRRETGVALGAGPACMGGRQMSGTRWDRQPIVRLASVVAPIPDDTVLRSPRSARKTIPGPPFSRSSVFDSRDIRRSSSTSPASRSAWSQTNQGVGAVSIQALTMLERSTLSAMFLALSLGLTNRLGEAIRSS